MLHLVRHAEPAIEPATPPAAWRLATSSATAVKELQAAGVLPATALWVSSPEVKALATAALLTDRPVRLDARLREAGRPWVASREGFMRLVRMSFATPERAAGDGWEPLVDVRQRVVAATWEAVLAAAGVPVVVSGHGTALTMLVTALTARPPDVEAWAALRMPDHCALSVPDAPGAGRAAVAGAWGDWCA